MWFYKLFKQSSALIVQSQNYSTYLSIGHGYNYNSDTKKPEEEYILKKDVILYHYIKNHGIVEVPLIKSGQSHEFIDADAWGRVHFSRKIGSLTFNGDLDRFYKKQSSEYKKKIVNAVVDKYVSQGIKILVFTKSNLDPLSIDEYYNSL